MFAYIERNINLYPTLQKIDFLVYTHTAFSGCLQFAHFAYSCIQYISTKISRYSELTCKNKKRGTKRGSRYRGPTNGVRKINFEQRNGYMRLAMDSICLTNCEKIITFAPINLHGLGQRRNLP